MNDATAAVLILGLSVVLVIALAIIAHRAERARPAPSPRPSPGEWQFSSITFYDRDGEPKPTPTFLRRKRDRGEPRNTIDFFDGAWHGLAEAGFCDSAGGAEYRRVKDEWLEAGRPVEIVSFIKTRANSTTGGAV